MLSKQQQNFLLKLRENKISLENVIEEGNLFYVFKDTIMKDKYLIPSFEQDFLFKVICSNEKNFIKYGLSGVEKRVNYTNIRNIKEFCYYYFKTKNLSIEEFKKDADPNWINLFKKEKMFDILEDKLKYKKLIYQYFLNSVDIKKTYFIKN